MESFIDKALSEIEKTEIAENLTGKIIEYTKRIMEALKKVSSDTVLWVIVDGNPAIEIGVNHIAVWFRGTGGRGKTDNVLTQKDSLSKLSKEGAGIFRDTMRKAIEEPQKVDLLVTIK